MSPTCTLPYEVLFELSNDTFEHATLRVLPPEHGGLRAGPTILVHTGDSISLVLTAGMLYKYAVAQRSKEVYLSVKLWQDTKYQLKTAFSAPHASARPSEPTPSLADSGVKIMLYY